MPATKTRLSNNGKVAGKYFWTSRPTLAHIETIISFGHNFMSGTNKKDFLEFRMLEKHVERLGFETTTFWTIVSH